MVTTVKNNIHLVDIIAQLVNQPVGVVYDNDIITYIIISSNTIISDDILRQATEKVIELNIEHENMQKINEAKAYLISTDWIVIKIGEAQLLDIDLASSLLEKYKVELAKRIECRELINSLNKI